MSHDIIQANYDTLEEVAQIFAEASQGIEEMLQEVRGGMENLRDEWIGLGSDAFFSKMGDEILPATVRLRDALVEASATTRIISITIITAEKEAASLFKNEGSPDAGAKRPASTEAPIPLEESGDYVLGPPRRPEIHHDNGFLDAYDPEEPTLQDYLQLAEWHLFLEGSKAATKAGVIDLDDANEAYEHFLEGKGADRMIDIDEFYAEDAAGQRALERLIWDAHRAAEALGRDRAEFQMVSSRAFAVSSDLPQDHPDYGKFEYPATENWQKTIGAHYAWSSADVEVSINPDGTRHYTMELTVHVEDRFNFNPEMKDIATGIPDAANGRFEITGLAHQYINYGETTRVIEWDESQFVDSGGGDATEHDNRGGRLGPNTRDRPRPVPRGVRDDQPRIRPPVDEATKNLREKYGR